MTHLRSEVLADPLHLSLLVLKVHGLVNETTNDGVLVERGEELLRTDVVTDL